MSLPTPFLPDPKRTDVMRVIFNFGSLGHLENNSMRRVCLSACIWDEEFTTYLTVFYLINNINCKSEKCMMASLQCTDVVTCHNNIVLA